MNIKTKALKFAIKAHLNQVRKSDKEKPMIIHPINVGNILEFYGFDDNVIAAGYLHDIIEDTKYTDTDILNKFGVDILSLVLGDNEPDKSMSWEERKEYTINDLKGLDLRHKSIACADKISNLEDLMIMFEIKGEYDFSAFKRGFDKQKWYYESIYNSLIENEDKNNPMFIRLKELIDHVFNNKSDNEYVKNIIFNNNDEYKLLKKIHYQKMEIYKLKEVLDSNSPYVIEFTGTPRTGKTTLINNLNDFFKKGNFKTEVLEEFTTSKKYKEKIYPLLKDKYKSIVNTEIPKYVLNELNSTLKKDLDIIIIDRSLLDRAIWIDRLYLKDGLNKLEYDEYMNTYIPLIKEKMNIIIATTTDSVTALKRDYNAYLALEKRKFLNEENVNEYNKSLNHIKNLSDKNNINLKLFDTTNKTEREISILVVSEILKNMKEYYILRLNKKYKEDV